MEILYRINTYTTIPYLSRNARISATLLVKPTTVVRLSATLTVSICPLFLFLVPVFTDIDQITHRTLNGESGSFFQIIRRSEDPIPSESKLAFPQSPLILRSIVLTKNIVRYDGLNSTEHRPCVSNGLCYKKA